jgi:hypothetical protein
MAISRVESDAYFGPFTDSTLANIALAIIREAVDDEAELLTFKCDPYKDQLKAGLKPYSISVELNSTGKVIDKKVELIWPPKDGEGLYDDRDFYKAYFIWAKSQSDAIMNLSRVAGRRV